MKSILHRIEDSKDWSDILDVLEEINRKQDIEKIKPIIPDLINHKKSVVRSEILELIGTFDLQDFLPLVKQKLEDRSFKVRSYALMAYYDLCGDRAIGLVSHVSQDTNIKLRLTALAILYVATGKIEVFQKIKKIVVRKRCNYLHQYTVFHIFQYYLNLEDSPEVQRLYEEMLNKMPSSYGIAEDLKIALKEVPMK